MGLYYNPPNPNIGAAQPLEPKKLTPASGPAPQNPPIIGARHRVETPLRSWVAAAAEAAAYPFMGTAQPLQKRLFTPPSGPTPQNPPIGGGSRSRGDVLQSWALAAAATAAVVILPRVFVPPAAAQASVPASRVSDAIHQSWNVAPPTLSVRRLLTPPVSGPTPDNPPFVGGAAVSQAALNWWIPPPPQPQTAILLDPPISGPTPDNPPFVGGAEVPQTILNWWLPLPPAPQSSILLEPPQSGPDFVFPRRGIPPGVMAWWTRELVVVDLLLPGAPQTPPDSAPVSGTATALAEVLLSWIPKPPAPIVARLLVPPISGPTPNNPPFMGGAKVPQAVLSWWIPPPPLPQLPEPFTASAQVAQNPPFVGGSRVPGEVLQWWAVASPLPQLPEFFVPAAVVEFTYPPARVPVAVTQWWSGAPQAAQLRKLLTPPQSGPVANNPPFVGGAQIRKSISQWWDLPVVWPAQARQYFPFVVTVTITPALPLDPNRVVTVLAESRIVTVAAESRTVTVEEASREV